MTCQYTNLIKFLSPGVCLGFLRQSFKSRGIPESGVVTAGIISPAASLPRSHHHQGYFSLWLVAPSSHQPFEQSCDLAANSVASRVIAVSLGLALLVQLAVRHRLSSGKRTDQVIRVHVGMLLCPGTKSIHIYRRDPRVDLNRSFPRPCRARCVQFEHRGLASMYFAGSPFVQRGKRSTEY